MASKCFHALALSAVLLISAALAEPLHAQGEKRSELGPPNPGGSDIAFEWQYSCTNGKGCSFSCPGTGGASTVTNPGSGGVSNVTNLGSVGASSVTNPRSAGASNVTKLAIHMGTIHLGGSHDVVGIFYEFSTVQIPRGNGFSITTGIGRLSCQVSGMNLDYSGPPKDRSFQPGPSGEHDR
jgi:hypothetical protein